TERGDGGGRAESGEPFMSLICLLCLCLLLGGLTLRRTIAAALEELWLSWFGQRAVARAVPAARSQPPPGGPPPLGRSAPPVGPPGGRRPVQAPPLRPGCLALGPGCLSAPFAPGRPDLPAPPGAARRVMRPVRPRPRCRAALSKEWAAWSPCTSPC